MQPIHESPRREIAPAAALHVPILAARDAAEHDAGECGVAGGDEGFFERGEGEEEEVREDVGAEEEGGEVNGEEVEKEVGEGVVVVGCEGVGGCDGVVPFLVQGGEGIGASGAVEETVDVVLEELWGC